MKRQAKVTKTKEDRAFGLLNRTYDLLVHGRDETGEACDLFDRVKLCNDIGDLLKRDEVFWVRRAARFSNEGFDVKRGKEIMLKDPAPTATEAISQKAMQGYLQEHYEGMIDNVEIHGDYITFDENKNIAGSFKHTISGAEYSRMLNPLVTEDPGELDYPTFDRVMHRDIVKATCIPAEYFNAPDCRPGQVIHGPSPSAVEDSISENYELLQQKLEEYYKAPIANILIRCDEVCFTVCDAGRHSLTIAEAERLCQ